MKIIEKKLTEIREYENNPRKNDKAIAPVAASIKNFGFQQPIVIDKNGVIVAGHTRYKAAKLLGLAKVPCVCASDLSEEQIRAYRIADNKTSDISEWDFAKLEKELEQIQEIEMNQFEQILLDAESIEEAEKTNKKESISKPMPNLTELTCRVIVDCKNVKEQQECADYLQEAGYNARTVTF